MKILALSLLIIAASVLMGCAGKPQPDFVVCGVSFEFADDYVTQLHRATP